LIADCCASTASARASSRLTRAFRFSCSSNEPARSAPAERDRSRRLLLALGAAERSLDSLTPVLKRAAGYERRPLDRQPGRVRVELELACRLSAELNRRLERARAALPALRPE
jgi:hypothetical protein